MLSELRQVQRKITRARGVAGAMRSGLAIALLAKRKQPNCFRAWAPQRRAVCGALSSHLSKLFCLRLLRIHQDESDAARLFAVIKPRMIGRLLDNDVAGFEMHRAGVE